MAGYPKKMKKILHILNTIIQHPQPIAFISLKFFGASFTKIFFSIKRNGYRLNLEDNEMSLSLFHQGKDVYRGIEILLETILKKGDNFIDIGGSIGFHSIYAKRIVENGSVIMVEPMPELVETATRNFNLNNLNITLVPLAINEDSNAVEMANLEGRSYIHNNDLKNISHDNDPTIIDEKVSSNKFKNTLSIDSCTLDSIAEKLDHISLIKIDTEGAELSSIKSGVNLFKKTDFFLVGLFDPYTTSRFGYQANESANFLIVSGFPFAYRISTSYRLVLTPLDMPNEKFDTPDYYLFSKTDLASLGLNAA